MTQAPLRRLVLEFKPDGIQVRTLYRSKDGPNPQTKARRREAEALAREGLRSALEALDAGDVTDLGTSGFSVREDVLHLPSPSSIWVTTANSPKQVKGEK